MATENKNDEYISAAIDDEDLSEELIDQLLHDTEAQQKWYQYHLISDYMRHGKSMFCQDIRPLCAELMAELEKNTIERQQNQLKLTDKKSSTKAANEPFVRFATFASIVTITMVTWQLWSHLGSQIDTDMIVGADSSAITSVSAPSFLLVSRGSEQTKTASYHTHNVVMPKAALNNKASEAYEEDAIVQTDKLDIVASSESKTRVEE